MSIAFNAASNGHANASSLTVAHTCTGSNLILIVSACEEGSGNGDNFSCTYNGVAMTKLDVNTLTNTNTASFYLINPATGAHNIVLSYTSGSDLSLSAASYTGVRQISQPDAHNKTGTSTPGTGFTASNTSVSDNCWTVLCVGVQGDGVHSTAISASTGATSRATNDNNSIGSGIFDANSAKTPAGSVSEAITFASGRYGYSIMSLAPVITVSVSDSVTMSDAISMIRQKVISVSEIINILEIQLINVSDSITTSEAYSSFKKGFRNLTKVASTFVDMAKTTISFLSAEVILDSYSETNKGNQLHAYNGSNFAYIAQSFTNTNSVILTTSKFYLASSGSPTGNAYAKIYAHSGTYGTSSIPTGSPLAISDAFDTSTLSASFGLKSFTFSSLNRITLNASTKYVTVIDCSAVGDSSNQVLVGYQGLIASHSGNEARSADGNLWFPGSLADICFYVYGRGIQSSTKSNASFSNQTKP